MTFDSHNNINDIKHLVGLAESKSPEQREFLYQKIGDFLANSGDDFSSAEKQIMGDIICRITGDVEKSIRANVARQLAHRDNVPKDLMVFLANDEIEVALPILKNSGLLSETDLLEIIRLRSTQHRLAIAARENISEGVCAALCECENPELNVVLLENHTARVSEKILEYLCDQSEFVPQYQAPLLRRPFLPRPIAEKMYRWVSVSLREYILEQYDVDIRTVNVDQKDRERAITAISSESDPSARLVEKLYKSGELSSRFMIKSLNQGEIDLFELSFAKLLDVDLDAVRRIVYANNPEILAAACRYLNIDRVIFKSIYDLIASIRKKDVSILDCTSPAPMGFYDLLTPEAANDALHNPAFMSGKIKYAETT